MKGISRTSLFYMRKLADSWPESSIVQQPAGQLPWGHLMVLLDRIYDQADRDWYAARADESGWSRKVLEHHIATDLRSRIGSGPSNFTEQLASDDSDLAREIVKDPYVFDFLDLADRQAERNIEQALMDRLQDTLLEFGRGSAFFGRQVRFDIDGDESFVDLLLFTVEQSRYVAVELKVGRFRHEYAGQLGFYVAMVDDELRRPALPAPTVGILLGAGRNERVVRYALRAAAAPMAVATYTYDSLPADERTSLPDVEALSAALLPEDGLPD